MTIQKIPISEINPESTINVRRSDVDKNVEKLRPSLRNHGYLPEYPALLRPDPNTSSGYRYEIISGQCRIRAAELEGIREVLAVVEELNDEEAHLRSFNENDKRSDLLEKDKTYWFERRYQEYRKIHGRVKSIEMVAEFYEVSTPTVRGYLKLNNLPESVLDDIDADIIEKSAGEAIAEKRRDDTEESDARLQSMAEWYKSLPRPDRQYARQTIKNSSYDATEEQLNEQLEQVKRKKGGKIQIIIPAGMEEALDEYGQKNGLVDRNAIIGYALAQQMKASGINIP